MQWRKFTRLKTSATGNSRCKAMLCCGRRKDNGRSVPDLTASPGRAPHQGLGNIQNQHNTNMQRQCVKEPVLLQGDFRKVSGISSEIFRQIESVENDHDPSTSAALEAVERRGEMIVRVLEPRCIGSRQSYEAAQRFLAKADSRHSVQLVEIVKRPGQTLGLYIREGNGADRSDGVFISRIALESAVYNSGCLRVSDEILAVNLVDVTKMSLDDVVIIMSIPRRLVLSIRTRRGRSNSPPPLTRSEQKPPVVVIKRDLRDDNEMMLDETDHISRTRSSRDHRRIADGREMSESRSRLGLGLANYSPQSEQIDLYYNNRPGVVDQTPNWNYKPPAPPSVITEQPKGNSQFQTSHGYYQNAGTLESLAEKVHSFYPGQPSRRMSDTRAGVPMSQSHQRFPRSGSADILPSVEYSEYSASLGRHSLLRSSIKSGGGVSHQQQFSGGTLGRYGRLEQSSRNAIKYSSPTSSGMTPRHKPPPLDYSSDTEATISRPNYYYYNKQHVATLGRGGTSSNINAGNDFTKFNSLPRDKNLSSARLNLRNRLIDRMGNEEDGNLSAPEYSLPALRRDRDIRTRITGNPSIFTSDEYRAWLRRAPSSSAICEQMRASRDILNQQRAHRFSCSAENIHDALKHHDALNNRSRMLGTLDRNNLGIVSRSGIGSMPVRSLSSQHIGGGSSLATIRSSPNIRRMRQLLELSTGSSVQFQSSSGGSISGHQSPAPTPSTTLPRTHRQIDINPAEFTKYKLDKPVMESQGASGMLWLNLLAGRGLRSTPEGIQTTNIQVRDLYCVIECDRVHKARTVVRSGDLQFDWDESFELDLVNNKQLDVLVYSWDPQHRHKLCYRGALAITSLIRTSPIHQLALKVEPRGTIYLRIRFSDPQQLYRRRGAAPALRGGVPSALFGADLETVVTREAKGAPGNAPVPIILRRCVEEIERRGLDIIGLYRLCGSATKKRLLREAFERNSRAVELSPEHVPDINVITGAIKDYLRELPEPLFTRCLFQMTVDALGVCLPDDPEGNAKLMLSILDCLPRANRATLVFLLDHLSLVVSASERNKMSAQALATALGPPLMLHSGSAQTDEIDHAQPIAVLKYLLQIWPQPATGQNVSGNTGIHRHDSELRTGMRGSKANVLQVAKQPLVVINNTPSSLARTQLSVTVSNPQCQSVVGQLAQSHRVLQPVPQMSQQLVASSASLEVRGQSPQQLQLVTPSPSSSSESYDSNSGTETIKSIKRAISPTNILVSTNTIKNEPLINDSINTKHEERHFLKDASHFSSDKTKKEDNASGPNTLKTSSDTSVFKSSATISTTSQESIPNTSSSSLSYCSENFDIQSSSDKSETRSNQKLMEKPFYKPINHSILASTQTTNNKTPSSSIALTKHKITNNFKLPPFPVYVPSTNLSTSSVFRNSEKIENFSPTKTSDASITFCANSISCYSPMNNVDSQSLNSNTKKSFLYQSESNVTNNSSNSLITATTVSNNQDTIASSASPFSTSNYTDAHNHATLPKQLTMSSDSYKNKFTNDHFDKNVESNNSYSYKYSADYYSNIATTKNGTSTYTSSLSDNKYKVQYSATNPFLDPLDSSPAVDNNESSTLNKTTRNGGGNSVSEIAKKFEKLDFDEDLK